MDSAEKPPFTLRGPQRERKIVSPFNAVPVRPELSRRANKGFSAESRIARHPGPSSPLSRWLMPLLIALLAFAAFLPALENGFVSWDDEKNFLENPRYRGLGWTQLRWMFTTFHGGHYQPLSWLTLGVDYVVWGMDPFGYHLTNLLLHAANAVVFYFITLHLLRLAIPNVSDGERRAFHLSAGFAALVFAIHPLRVESVVWATERRDVLSGLFFLLTILCYLRANMAVNAGSARVRWMIATFVVFLLCLFSKAVGIILPVVLLAIDVYPLGRLGGRPERWFGPAARRVWWEKVPFLLLALAFGVIAILAQRKSEALEPLQQYGFTSRIAQVIFGVAFYLWKTVIPLRLSPLYELPEELKLWDWSIILAAVTALAVSAGVVALRRRWPAGLAVWVYYLVVVAPVSGVAQSGPQIAADRYTYLACLGWAILAGAGLLYAWRLWIAGKIRPRTFIFIDGLLVTALIVLAALTWRQVGIWRDSETLWTHVLAIDQKAGLAHNNLGTVLFTQGKLEEAIRHYRQALQTRSGALVYYNLANAQTEQGRLAEAKESYLNAIQLNPDFAKAHYNLGNLFVTSGKLDEARRHYGEAVRIDPHFSDAHNNLGNILAMQGALPEAIQHFREAVRIEPEFVEARQSLGRALAEQGKTDEAVQHYQEALRILKSRPKAGAD